MYSFNSFITAIYAYGTNLQYCQLLYNEWYCLFLILHIYTGAKDTNSSKKKDTELKYRYLITQKASQDH